MWHADDGQLNALLDGELPAEEAREVRAHLEGCPECARRLEEARAFLEQAGELLAVLTPAPAASSPPAPRAVPVAPTVPERPAIEPPLVAPLARGPADSGSTRKTDRSTGPRMPPTSKEVAVNIDGRTALTPAIRPVTRAEVPGAAKRPWQLPGLDKLAWAASLILCLGVGYLVNEVKNLREAQRQLAYAPAREPVTATSAPAERDQGAANASVARAVRSPPAGAGATRAAGGEAERRSAPRDLQRAAPPPGRTARTDSDPARPAAPKPRNAVATKPPPRAAQPQPTDVLSAAQQPAASALEEAPVRAPVGAPVGAPAAPAAPAQGAAMAPSARPAPGALSGVAGADARARQGAGAPASPDRSVGRGEVAGNVGAREGRAFADSAAPLTSFRRITIDEAVRRLSGTIRLIDGLNPARVDVGPGRLVQGADPERDVVRVTYTDGQGARIVLDQQVGDVRTASFNGLMQGDTLVTTTDAGGTRLRWVDRKFWLSLTGIAGADSLRNLVARIR